MTNACGKLLFQNGEAFEKTPFLDHQAFASGFCLEGGGGQRTPIAVQN